MANDYNPDRWEEIQQIHHDNHSLYQMLGGVLLVAIGLVIGNILFSGDEGYATNLFTEALSLGATVFVLNLLAKQREERTLKKRLIQQLGSSFNIIALTALEELWSRGWLQDGSLRGVDLSRADLRGADLGKANLTGVQFFSRRYGHVHFDEHTRLPDETFWQEDNPITDIERYTNPDHPEYWQGFGLHEANLARRDYTAANLRGADMFGCNLWNAQLIRANLQHAILIRARLRNTNLTGANLINAELDYADLRQANLMGADFSGADMQGVDLEGAELSGAKLDGARLVGAILPNSEKYQPGMDMSVFGVVGTPSDEPRPLSPSGD